MSKLDYPQWFFMWARPQGREYITTICGWTRTEVKNLVVDMMDQPWRKTYEQGGRIVSVRILL